ncbi:MAG: hypothetical protein JWP09_945 [Candidatus Taylorbacteria bacterium]|nr:hypothetical protein [Candidatus Taylorbacteria bacterium]
MESYNPQPEDQSHITHEEAPALDVAPDPVTERKSGSGK